MMEIDSMELRELIGCSYLNRLSTWLGGIGAWRHTHWASSPYPCQLRLQLCPSSVHLYQGIGTVMCWSEHIHIVWHAPAEHVTLLKSRASLHGARVTTGARSVCPHCSLTSSHTSVRHSTCVMSVCCSRRPCHFKKSFKCPSPRLCCRSYVCVFCWMLLVRRSLNHQLRRLRSNFSCDNEGFKMKY